MAGIELIILKSKPIINENTPAAGPSFSLNTLDTKYMFGIKINIEIKNSNFFNKTLHHVLSLFRS